ncbi:hypothetical protein [Flavobacterium silvaticum]|uniref:Uncharacterized protein n=1 Tax=Flavobacterium silvaticum TaxID=1852020 RepID=A0A972JHS9_9FLAO|nr:hypothetical protein [Flavobacterium silvaticum]NMH28260.1 hypothetical protein [Flavobacterium silvaticum]
MSSKTNHGFSYAIFALLLLLISWFLFIVLMLNRYFSAGKFFLFPMLISPILAVIGLVYSVKGIREPNTFKKIFGLILNVSIPSLFIAVIVKNAIEIYRAIY